ncbi:MAG: 3-isopropylmalate dehydratase small subunit [Kiritimatiellaeota bacterium]|nr:3-isopropylmalate dehydratase small subunit [Kiritimatiellota bacterium]
MNPFTVHTGIVAPLDRANVDTDAIIPKQFLKLIGRTGFGQYLFFDSRYFDDGRPNPAFALNQPAFAGATVLVARNNFGCGSSREHAVWAVAQYGFRTVIAPWKTIGGARVPAFADIFRNNCGKNGVLTIELAEDEVDRLFNAVQTQPGLTATVDLPQQAITLHTAPEQVFRFEVDPGLKQYLLRGLDEIALTLDHAADIAAFEQRHDVQLAATR